MFTHSGATGKRSKLQRSRSMFAGNRPWAPKAANLWVRGDIVAPFAYTGFFLDNVRSKPNLQMCYLINEKHAYI